MLRKRVNRSIILMALVLTASSVIAQPKEKKIRRAAEPIKGEYIVSLAGVPSDRVPETAMGLALGVKGRLLGTVKHGIQAFGIEMNENAAKNLLRNPLVAGIEENALGHFSYEVEYYNDSTTYWHLDRIDQYTPVPQHSVNAYGWTYDGTGVDIYIIDMGVMTTHNEFGDRAIEGPNFSGDTVTTDLPCGPHGTWVASLAGGETVGVARNANLISLRISPCEGPNMFGVNLWGVIQAIDWVIDQRQAYQRPSVINMSFYQLDPEDDWCNVDREGNPYPCISMFEQQIQEAITEGITVVNSANNQNLNRCAEQTPARLGYGNETNYPAAGRTITVGGTNIDDDRHLCPTCRPCSYCRVTDPGSNFGPCVSFYAPAHKIKFATTTSTNSYSNNTIENGTSGTSFASPIVAGAVARWLDQYPWLSPADIWYWLYATATQKGDLDGDGIDANNRILYIDVYH